MRRVFSGALLSIGLLCLTTASAAATAQPPALQPASMRSATASPAVQQEAAAAGPANGQPVPAAERTPRTAAARSPGVLVFAAASLTDALQALGSSYQKNTGVTVKLSFAASSLLAREIEAGAPADVFFSADTDWMDYLQSRNLIRARTRRNLLGNRLVLIAPASSRIELRIAPHFALAAALGTGRLATGDPDLVPVGRYARAALITLGVWNGVAGRIARAENVRMALRYVARGEAPLGIVYASDALVEKKVRVVGTFPASTHPPIVYPIALTKTARPDAAVFVAWLGGAQARRVFTRYGFTQPER